MKRTCATVVLLGSLVSGLHAAGVDEARALIAAGKPGEVDTALGSALTDDGGTPEALRTSFDAAIADGRMLTAQQRATALLKTGYQDAGFLWQAARLADGMGDESVALGRYQAFVRAVATADERSAAALRYLLARGTYPDEYQRYLTTVAARGGEAFALGMTQLERLLESGDPAAAMTLAAKVAGTADTTAAIDQLHAFLWTAADRGRTGSDPASRYVAPLKVMLAGGDPSNWTWVFHCADRAFAALRETSAAECAELMLAIAERTPINHQLRQHAAVVRAQPDEAKRLAWGKRYLATEARHTTPESIWEFIVTVIDLRNEVFIVPGKELITGADLVRRLDAVAKTRVESARGMFSHIVFHVVSAADRVQIVRDRLDVASPDAVADACGTLINGGKESDAEALIAAAIAKRPEFATQLGVHLMSRWKDAPRVIAATRQYLVEAPIEFNADHVIGQLLNRDLGTPAERLAPLLELAQRGGATHPGVAQVIARLDQDATNWQGKPHYDAFRKAVAAAGDGSDPVMRTLVRLFTLPWNQAAPDAGYLAAASELAKQVTLPSGDATRDRMIWNCAMRHLTAVWGDRDQVVKAADLWLPRFGRGAGGNWEPFVRRVQEHSANDVLARWLPAYTALARADAKDSHPAVWFRFSYAVNPPDDKQDHLSGVADLAGPWAVANYVLRNSHIAPPQAFPILAKVIDAPAVAADRSMRWHIISWVSDRTTRELPAPDAILTAMRDGMDNPDIAWRLFVTLGRADAMGTAKGQEALAAWRALGSGKRTPVAELNALMTFASHMPTGERRPGERFHFYFTEILPALEKLGDAEVGGLHIQRSVIQDTWQWQTWPAAQAADRAAAERLSRAVVRAALAGARFDWTGWDLFQTFDREIAAAVAARDWPRAYALTRLTARNVPADAGQLAHLEQSTIAATLKAIKDAKAHEFGFRYADTLARAKGIPPDKAEAFAIQRSEFARALPDFGADPNDPFSDLHSAGRALQLGNEERAWQLTSPKLKLLQERWHDLDPSFAAWAAEQMRRQKMGKQALEFCRTLLVKDDALDAEIAGRIKLVQGDLFVDLQNFQAARIEYEGLRNNSRYRDTQAGAKARYRLVSLLIATKDYARAEELVQQLTETDRIEVQAEGWYLKACLANDQADYETARKALDECFQRQLDHVEGRLLEGELRLKVRGGLTTTDVEVGTPELATTLVPGRPLTLKLNDKNLEISQGDASIPILVRTSTGGDEEKLFLNPSSNQRSIFSATLATALGVVKANDQTLQVRGDDEVTYQIDPAFQKAHALTYQPKQLVVRYPAKLTASAGEILGPEEQRRRELERRERMIRGEVSARDLGRDPNTIRPGSPIFIQVTDLAADLGDQADTVVVDARSVPKAGETGGRAETVRGIALTETGPHTGVFRGELATVVPGARVSASDSEEGRDPGALIRAGNDQTWSSLPDGKRPKWVEVDTMAATLVSGASIAVPDLKGVRRLKLMGRQYGAYEELAAWPAQDRSHRGRGLTTELFNGTDLQGTPSVVPSDGVIDFVHGGTEIVKGGPNQSFSVRWSGSILAPESGEYVFSTESDDGVRLWVGDRKLIDNWTAHGTTVDKGAMTLAAGQRYPIRLEYFQGAGGWRIALRWQTATIPAQVIPASALRGDGDDVEKRSAQGGLRVVAAPGSVGSDPSLLVLRNFLAATAVEPAYRHGAAFDRADTPGRDRAAWQVARVDGVFALPTAGEYEFRLAGAADAGAAQVGWLVIDGMPVVGGQLGDKATGRTGKAKLAIGVHALELFAQDNAAAATIAIEYRAVGQGAFAALPDEWFAWDKHPELAHGVVPAVIEQDGKGFVATLAQPRRLRALRWVFEDFAGNAIQASALGVTDAEAGAILPAAADAARADGATLLVAPGETIDVTYSDERRLRADEATISVRLNSSFANGEIAICDEAQVMRQDKTTETQYRPVRRCRVGDALQIVIADSDPDLGEQRDVITVQVTTSSGERIEVAALETDPRAPANEHWARHAGQFMALLRIGTQSGKDTIGVRAGDLITVSYLDGENTDPGVPCERAFTIETAGSDEPSFAIYRTRTRTEPDDSPEAKARAERMRMRGRKVEREALTRTVIDAAHPDRLDAALRDAPAIVDVGAPLLFEVRWPAAALNSGSRLIVEAAAASELAAATAAQREPVWTEVPVTIVPIGWLAATKGFLTRIDRAPADSGTMLQEGSFAGILRFQLGNPGDPVDELVVKVAEFASKDEIATSRDRFRLPTVVVGGADTLHLRLRSVQDSGASAKPAKKGKKKAAAEAAPAEPAPVVESKAWTCDVTLRSAGRIDLLDDTYAAQTPRIHLGEAFNIQVVDPDRDTSDARDSVVVDVALPSGATQQQKLVETLAHSGIFTAKLRTVFADDAKPAAPDATAPAGDATVAVRFGDDVVFTYRDPSTLGGGGSSEAAVTGRIAHGSDGEQAVFTKRFNDAEMAVKTQFLVAEALFEMAKDHRKLKQEELAKKEIQQGRRALEEALRDYPNTTLLAQGEFLLANLSEELDDLTDAITRYSAVISRWPDSEFAARSQFKIALCQQKRGNMDEASESFVKVIYLYPDSELAADATLRLGNYYHQNKQYLISSKVFAQFQRAHPEHPKAPKALFMAASSNMKAFEMQLIDARQLAGTIEMFDTLIKQYADDKEVRPIALYWKGDLCAKLEDFKGAYQSFKKLTWEYPESKEAKMARGRLTDAAFERMEADE
ncbi:MAG TPA: PA14 domain-containing protein [Planctomycetota bacterium]|nr:PA14 domain-containing protein [Planctomycetota bacterium]